MAKIFLSEDCNLSLEGKTIAIIGYGSQVTHALNLKDSGMSCYHRSVLRAPSPGQRLRHQVRSGSPLQKLA